MGSNIRWETVMITSSIYGNNRLIRKTILRMYPSSFAANLTVNIALMVDTLLAGAILGQQAIAAVAIGLPAIGIFQALAQTIVSGSGVKMAVYAGKGDQSNLNRTYSLGALTTVVFGLVFMAICLLLADPLTMLFGGAKNPATAAQAALYLRAGSGCVLMGTLNTFFGRALALYGYQKEVSFSAMIAMIGNIIFSIIYMNLLPDNLAIMGLGAGTWCGGALACLFSYMTIKRNKIPLRFRIKDADIKELPELFCRGISTSGNKLADNLVAGIVNNLIVGAFGGDTTALSVYTAAKSIIAFCDAAEKSIQTAISPLLGILYGSRDRNGIVRTVKEGCKLGVIVSVIWGGAMLALLPFMAKFYGMEGNSDFRIGVIFGLVCTPFWIIMHIFTQVFESTEKPGMGLLYSSVPDSIIYPIMLMLLLPSLKYNGIWIAYNLNAIPFLLVLYLIRVVKLKDTRITWDRMLCLDEAIRDNVPMLDISIRSNNTDVTGLSEQVHEFLTKENASERTAYMTALCLEELAADFVQHTMQENAQKADDTIMDIKLFSDSDSLKIVIRNAASRYNPLEFDLDDETFAKVGVKLVQKICRRIEYNYVYRMNIVTIDVAK